jgi:REP element-mobilizing transposase RayT
VQKKRQKKGTLMHKSIYSQCKTCQHVTMPRSARLDAPGVLHHVMGRGIEKQSIFSRTEDRSDFIARLADLAASGGLAIYAWTLMPTHFHLLCKTGEVSLADCMRKLLTGYAINFNRRHRRNGHVFQNRYKSIVCQEDRYFKELVRYIHLNRLRGGLEKDLHALDDCPWSGHSAIMGACKRQWQQTEYVLAAFGGNDNARSAYRNFVAAGVNLGSKPELVGGGLIRSRGGWSAVLSMRRRGRRSPSDERILGSDEFVRKTVSSMTQRMRQTLHFSDSRIPIDRVAQRVCDKYDVSLTELCSATRRRAGVRARQTVAWIAVRELGHSGADVARFLGVSNSCVTRFIAKGERPQIDDLLVQLQPKERRAQKGV